jgi:predicted metal-dependent phosphoesterase TrpH
MIDLHSHSNASDGALSPTELVKYAREKGLVAIAITDHDTVEGVEEALTAGKEFALEVVPGIEISAEFPEETMHILGYYMDSKDQKFIDNISVLQKARAERNPRIVKNLQKLGLNIEYDEILKEAGSGQVGRPHFAKVLLNKGYVKTTQQAFNRYLKKGAPGYEDKFRFQPEAAISHILSAGGLPVLAHPATLRCKTEDDLETEIKKLISYGLKGIEAYYSDHTNSQTEVYIKLADKYGLFITGGSDFHGHNVKGIDLGTGKGKLDVPYEFLQKMKESR